MSLEPPEKLRSLQRKLYGKAKAAPDYRFYLLYDKIHRPDVLAHAYALARRKDGASGVTRNVRSDRGVDHVDRTAIRPIAVSRRFQVRLEETDDDGRKRQTGGLASSGLMTPPCGVPLRLRLRAGAGPPGKPGPGLRDDPSAGLSRRQAGPIYRVRAILSIMVLDMPISQRPIGFPATSLPAPAAAKKTSLPAAAKPPQAIGATRLSAVAGEFYPAGGRRQGKTALTDRVPLVPRKECPRSAMMPGLAFLLIAAAARILAPDLLGRLSLIAFDFCRRMAPRAPTNSPVAIVDIDDKSLAAIAQWAWPRTIIVQLVEKLAKAGAAVVAFDIDFAEPDRTSPRMLLPLLVGNGAGRAKTWSSPIAARRRSGWCRSRPRPPQERIREAPDAFSTGSNATSFRAMRSVRRGKSTPPSEDTRRFAPCLRAALSLRSAVDE